MCFFIMEFIINKLLSCHYTVAHLRRQDGVDEVKFQKEGAVWMAMRERAPGTVSLKLDGDNVVSIFQLGHICWLRKDEVGMA